MKKRKIDWENADLEVVVRPAGTNYSNWEISSGDAIFSESGKTAYVFQDDITMDTYRKTSDGLWICFGVPKQKWRITYD